MNITDYPEATSIAGNDALLLATQSGTKNVNVDVLLSGLASFIVFRVNISSDNWILDAVGAHRSFDCPGIKASDMPIVDLDFTWTPDLGTQKAEQDSWSLVYNVEAKDNQIEVYATKVPGWMPIKLLCVRRQH